MVELEGALSYPLEDDDWPVTVGIGGGLVLLNTTITTVGTIIAFLLSMFLIGFLLFPPLFLLSLVLSIPIAGYMIAVLRWTIAGESNPPRFSDWGRLCKDGIVVIGIAVVYSLPHVLFGTITFAVMLGGTILMEAVGGEAATAIGLVVAFGSQLLYFAIVAIYSLVMMYLIPVSMAIYADEGNFWAAFSLDRIKRVGLNVDFLIYWVIAVAILMAAGQILQFFMLIIVGFFMQFYVLVVAVRLIGLGYADAMNLDSATA